MVPGFNPEAEGSSHLKVNADESARRVNRSLGKGGGKSARRRGIVPQRKTVVTTNANLRSKRVGVTNDAKKGFMAFSRNESNSGLTQKPLRFVKPDKLFLVSGNKVPHRIRDCRRTPSGGYTIRKDFGVRKPTLEWSPMQTKSTVQTKNNILMKTTLKSIGALALTLGSLTFSSQSTAATPYQVTYHTAHVDGLNLFYREAGDPARPTVVLLHGFPSSSHMYRDLIPKLAGSYHVVAPDYPGYGYSDQPSVSEFAYTFDHLAAVTDDLLNALKLEKYSIYIQDYGSPVGFRLFVKHPERIETIITQNGNAYDEGLSPFWDEYLRPYWKEKTPETEAKVRGLLTLGTTQFQYTAGFHDTNHVSPDAWTHDQATLDRPGNQAIQLALFYDYQNNLTQYDLWHSTLRKAQPPVLAVWGKNDPIFPPAGALAFKKDVPKVEIHLLDTGHFALEEEGDAIANYILKFLGQNVK